ncbi:MAG: nucleotidyltransferase [Cellulosilyticaceae bacterium]
MKIAGIIVEYNPFHNGHLYQISEIKKTLDVDAIIVIMSGQFTQRGTPCICDKFSRAKMALDHGVDLVIELPIPFATASAQYFAEAAVSILHKLGCVTKLSFGCETPNLALLKRIANTLLNEPATMSAYIKVQLSEGVSFPRARQMALEHYLSSELSENDKQDLSTLLNNPNNILAIEYIKALLKYNSTITPCPLARKSSNYHDIAIFSPIASATAIRKQLTTNSFSDIQSAMPCAAYETLIKNYLPLITTNDFSDMFHYNIIFSNLASLYAIWDLPNSLARSIYRESKNHTSIESLINAVTSKSYSRATVSRAILRILLQIKTEDILPLENINWIPYIRVLSCAPSSKHVLAHVCRNASVPVITKFNSFYKKANTLEKSLLDLEYKSTQLYSLKKQNTLLANSDFTTSIFTHP